MRIPIPLANLRNFICGCIFMLWAIKSFATPPSIEPLRRGAWSLGPFGNAWAVCVESNRAYVSLREAGLLIFDISTPSAPRRLGGNTTKGAVYDVVASGKYAYLADGKIGLRIVDVSDSANPITVGTLRLPVGDAVKVALEGTLAYVLDTGNKMRIVDVENPFLPTLVGTYSAAGRPVDLVVRGGYAYLANNASNQGFEVVAVSDPAHPVFVGGNEQWNAGGSCNGVRISGNLAYLTGEGGDFNIVDISDPANQQLLGNLQIPSLRGLAISGSHAYVVVDNGMQIIDVSDPAHPIRAEVSYPDSPVFARDQFYTGTVWDVAASQNYAYLAVNGIGLIVVDVGTTNCVAAASAGTTGAVRDVAVNGNLAYVAYEAAGLQVVDVGEPSSPVHLGGINDNILGIELSDGYAYTIGPVGTRPSGLRVSGLAVYYLHEGTNLTRVGRLSTTVAVADLAVSGGFAYLASDNDGLQIVDVSNPTNAILVGGYKYGGTSPGSRPAAFGVAVSGNLIYLAYGTAGLLVLDASNPTNCVLLGRYDTPDRAVKVAVTGSFAFVADVSGGLQMINVTNPEEPEFAGSYTSGGDVVGVSVRGNQVYVASGSRGFQVLDASDPSRCILLADDKSSRFPSKFDVANDRLYVADFLDGLRILPHIPNVQFTLRVNGTPNLPLTVQAARTSDQALTWTTLFTTNAFSGAFDFVDTDVMLTNGNHKLYRVRQP